MRFSDVIKTAFYNLWRKKFRTFLTVLAIIIGAVLIALMTSIGTGLQRFIVDQFGLMVTQDALTVYATERSFTYVETPMKLLIPPMLLYALLPLMTSINCFLLREWNA